MASPSAPPPELPPPPKGEGSSESRRDAESMIHIYMGDTLYYSLVMREVIMEAEPVPQLGEAAKSLSVENQIRKNEVELESARRTLRKFRSIKDEHDRRIEPYRIVHGAGK
ncbi:hypothetical protein PIB30_008515 [Stylosanthes scabra]|uniref:Uncharacterized protein n=1 Tax=Stylosanthes scabra TaxID=79078 RepID=A0ABU6Z4L0_9FABA|nr:hypothetical protein [Stylosanthes scabra]